MTGTTDEGSYGETGVEKRDVDGVDVIHPDDQDQPEGGPTMTMAGAMPSGSNMDHWATAMPNPDATKPETMPNTASAPMPGETEDRDPV